MKSPFEKLPQPEKNNKPETAPADPLARLKEALERKEKPEEPSAQPMSVGRMEDVRELLKKMDLETFLGQKTGHYTSEKEQLEKEQNLIKEFSSAKGSLDSNTKEKLYGHIFEENFKPKLEEVFNKISKELKELEIIKNIKDNDSSEEEKKLIYAVLSVHTTKTGLTRLIGEELKKLEEFGFDKQRLNELKEKFKSLKKK